MKSKGFPSSNSYMDKEDWCLILKNTSIHWGAIEEPKNDSCEEIGDFLSRELKRIGIDLKITELKSTENESTQILNVGREFPVALLKSLFVWETGKELSMDSVDEINVEPEFIVGNHYAAFTNNSRFKYYVPSIRKGFESHEDVFGAVSGDLSNCRILLMQYIDLHNLPEYVESSEILNPYSLGLNEKKLSERFPALVAERKKIKEAYIRHLLEQILQVSFDRKVICHDISGAIGLIDASKIIRIIPNSEDNEKLSAEIVFDNNGFMKVNLVEFAKDFAGLVSEDRLSLPTSLENYTIKTFLIAQTRDDELYRKIWALYEKNFIDWKENHINVSIIDAKYDYVSDFCDGLACVKLDGKWGYIDKNGEIIIKPKYDGADSFKDGLARVKLDGKWGYIDKYGRFVIEPVYDKVFDFSNGLARVCDAYNRWRFIDKNGKLILGWYEDAEDFNDGLAWVRDGKTFGFINKNGEWIFGPTSDFFESRGFKEGLAYVLRNDGKYGFISKDGELVIEPQFNYARNFSEGMAVVQDNKYLNSYIDKKGKLIIKPKFWEARDFKNDIAFVREDKKIGCINKKGEWVIEPIIDADPMYGIDLHFVDGIAIVSVEGKRGCITDTGSWILKPVFDSIDYFKNEIACVQLDGKYGYIDKGGKWIIEPQFDWAKNFSDGVALVVVGGKYGYIDNKGKFIIEPRFDSSYGFSNGLARIKVDGKFGYIDKEGNCLIEPQFDMACDFSDGLARVAIDQKEGCINKKGNWIINPRYDYISDFKNGVAVVKKNGKKGYVIMK